MSTRFVQVKHRIWWDYHIVPIVCELYLEGNKPTKKAVMTRLKFHLSENGSEYSGFHNHTYEDKHPDVFLKARDWTRSKFGGTNGR